MSKPRIEIDDAAAELELDFEGLAVTTASAADANRRTCVSCDTEYPGNACPACGLRYRPRCPDCGARLVWSGKPGACHSCGAPTPDVVYFERRPPAPAEIDRKA